MVFLYILIGIGMLKFVPRNFDVNLNKGSYFKFIVFDMRFFLVDRFHNIIYEYIFTDYLWPPGKGATFDFRYLGKN